MINTANNGERTLDLLLVLPRPFAPQAIGLKLVDRKPEKKPEQVWFEGMEDKEERIDLDKLEEEAERMIAAGTHSANTLLAWEGDWKGFKAWCRKAHSSERAVVKPLPCDAKTVIGYVNFELNRGMKTSTIARRLATINAKHKAAGYPSPVTKKAWEQLRVRRREGKEKSNAKAALSPEQLADISRALGKDNQGVRNRALMLLGVALASRRSELVSYNFQDLAFEHRGVSVHLRKSKRDQEFVGRKIGVFPVQDNPDVCPLTALKAWLEVRGNWDGPLFNQLQPRNLSVLKKGLSGDMVNKIVKNSVKLIGLPPERYGGHTLRASCATIALDSGVIEAQVIKITGHKTAQMLDRYHRPDPFAFNVLARGFAARGR